MPNGAFPPVHCTVTAPPWAFGADADGIAAIVRILKHHRLAGVRDNWPGAGIGKSSSWYDVAHTAFVREQIRSHGLSTVITVFNANEGVGRFVPCNDTALERQMSVAQLANENRQKELRTLAAEALEGAGTIPQDVLASALESRDHPLRKGDMAEPVNPDLYPLLTQEGFATLWDVASEVAAERGIATTGHSCFVYDHRPTDYRLTFGEIGPVVAAIYPCEVGVARYPMQSLISERLCRAAGLAGYLASFHEADGAAYGHMVNFHEAVPAGYGPSTWPDPEKCRALWEWKTYRKIRKSLGITDEQDRFALLSRNGIALASAVTLLSRW